MSRARALASWLPLALIALLPLTLLWSPLVAGVRASGADLMIALFLLAGALAGVAAADAPDEADPRGVFLLVLFAVWVSIGASWSSAPLYAVAKAVGYGALALTIAMVVRFGLAPTRAADAWLVGSGLTLTVLVLGVLLTPLAADGRVLFEGGGIAGLPIRRARGPFSHPNAFGDYLVLSLALLAGRWTSEGDRWSLLRWALLVGLSGALIWSASSAILGAGVILVALGVRCGLRSWASRGAAVAGALVTMVVLAGAVRTRIPGFNVELNGVRPAIWASAAETFWSAPIRGVGATPTVATAVDPAMPSIGPIAWDAHSLVLSVLSQYGLIGSALLAGGVLLLVGPVVGLARRGTGPEANVAWGLTVGLLAWAAHGLLIAGEDQRHAWVFLAIAATCRWRAPQDVAR